MTGLDRLARIIIQPQDVPGSYEFDDVSRHQHDRTADKSNDQISKKTAMITETAGGWDEPMAQNGLGRQLCLRYKSTSGQSALGTLEVSKLKDFETELGRFGHRLQTSMTRATVEDSTAGLGTSLMAARGMWAARRNPGSGHETSGRCRTTACDPHALGGAQCGEQRGPGPFAE